jgi:hypothetical protein
MNIFEVWMEGYVATGESSGAHCLGTVEAENFDEACIKVAGEKSLDKTPEGELRRGRSGNYSIWACNLYPTEQEARASFG